jgi:prepilin-type N-terminal cleavage/methylation domain-containing protein
MNNKGFSLVELLAVIVVLAIIAMIATPIVLNVINDARESANMDSVSGIYHAIEVDYAEEAEFSGNVTYEYNASNGTLTATQEGVTRDVSLSGSLGRDGQARGTANSGNIKVAAFIGGKCYTKLNSKGSPVIDSATDASTCLAKAN